MKMVSVVVAGLGVLALILAIAERLFTFQLVATTPGGYLRLATTLFLLALVVMCYGKCYCCCKEESKPQP